MTVETSIDCFYQHSNSMWCIFLEKYYSIKFEKVENCEPTYLTISQSYKRPINVHPLLVTGEAGIAEIYSKKLLL